MRQPLGQLRSRLLASRWTSSGRQTSITTPDAFSSISLGVSKRDAQRNSHCAPCSASRIIDAASPNSCTAQLLTLRPRMSQLNGVETCSRGLRKAGMLSASGKLKVGKVMRVWTLRIYRRVQDSLSESSRVIEKLPVLQKVLNSRV